MGKPWAAEREHSVELWEFERPEASDRMGLVLRLPIGHLGGARERVSRGHLAGPGSARNGARLATARPTPLACAPPEGQQQPDTQQGQREVEPDPHKQQAYTGETVDPAVGQVDERQAGRPSAAKSDLVQLPASLRYGSRCGLDYGRGWLSERAEKSAELRQEQSPRRPPLPPRSAEPRGRWAPGQPPLNSSPCELIEEKEGPLWRTVRRQLYRSEVAHIKRLVGEELIQQNKLMWEELTSLRQILTDFQEQNDELSESLKKQVQFCGTQHRELLRRQAQIMLEDLTSQAEACGHVLEDLVPELRDPEMAEFVFAKARRGADAKTDSVLLTPPQTPSTRPPSSSGLSGCSTPDPATGVPPLPLGRALGVDELAGVAEGIREAIEAEQEMLLAAIGEQMQQLEAEDARRVYSATRGGGPSTSKLQQFVHSLQDLALSPSLRTLSLAGPVVSPHFAGCPDGGWGSAAALPADR
ncbi:unnamed protein product, partial [Prorocentrum cordatum]